MKSKIGNFYKYPVPGNNKLFKLIKIEGYKYLFECGHWCTDNVFIDLIEIERDKQLTINFN
jgi:hypothetical protein